MSRVRNIKRFAVKFGIYGVLVCGVGAVSLSSAPVWAQQVASEKVEIPSAKFDEALQKANRAYNEEKYADAVESYVQAIQERPDRPEPYRNMARAYFWAGQYNAALAYYDTYLTTFPGASDREQIEKERRLTSDRTSKPWSLPEAQRVAMRSLEAALAGDEMYARGGAGAWQSYQALLRTGYAQPALSKFRDRLFQKMMEEHDRMLEVKSGQTAPELDTQAWELQEQRAKAAEELVVYTVQRDEVQRRQKIHKAAEALFLSRYEDAAMYAEQAIEANEDALFLRWFFITALMRANKTDKALRELEKLEQLLEQESPEQLQYVDVVRAMLLQRLDRQEDAASIYKGLFLKG